ncbi:Maintenance of ploidy protein mob1, putative [Entamoeba invadens IP1]|uniref:Maintenance of ploidy protein mob1, putative n=1 Tax=Entamoeba invadens IP1 TaxID=370355 RepID=A0A0A1U564_ENTIV|nr:Maintenance of ploidy protein mob1, putative [Entamoeba invadens IP1]ELP86886.1 Maintenance of ploidy protein mob1, putative [Entamoeba invadens IP1]|eukprot:XP_004253657.1 Maintenance of ploidy protein mob1, putative [Entamoeba invadens IP1]
MFSKAHTIKPKKKAEKGTIRYDLHNFFEKAKSGDIINGVKCPEGQNLYEWLSVNGFDFLDEIQLLYSPISDLCTPSNCPQMNAGPQFEYLWMVDKKPTSMPAQQYCSELFIWASELFDDQSIFPEEFKDKPPKKFMDTITKIFKRLIRVYAHMFYSHMDDLKGNGNDQVAMQSFQHFFFFCREFKMLSKDDIAPLEPIINEMCKEHGVPVFLEK